MTTPAGKAGAGMLQGNYTTIIPLSTAHRPTHSLGIPSTR